MKKLRVIYILCFLTANIIYCQDQTKNIVGISAGIIPAYSDMYFDDPLDYWPYRELSPVYNVFFARQLNEYFRIGGYLEYEKANYSDDNTESTKGSFKRYNFGLNWIIQYPKTPLHMQLGGYVGYGFLKAQDWDNLFGLDFGAIAGPAYEKNKLGFAVQVHSGHAWYNSSGSPEEVMLYSPKILFKVYFKL